MPSISHNPLNPSGSSPQTGPIRMDVSPLESSSKRKRIRVAGISESDASRTIDASMTQCQLDGRGPGTRFENHNRGGKGSGCPTEECMIPPSSSAEVLKRIVQWVLGEIPLEIMRKFVYSSCRGHFLLNCS
ncbi:hypothetical protein AN958_07820 [Leucoagaricus sp. SymC.cos]|nr:hypothetical protein AN958_07820 [Leucoagaricus sp. SymC.cos]